MTTPTPLFWTGCATTLLALGPLLYAEQRDRRDLSWFFKPVASTGFVVAALGAGALDSTFGTTMLVGLALSWLGDVLLIPASSRTFVAGLGSFLLGHVAFAVAFAGLGLDETIGLRAAAALVIAMTVVFRWLMPHVPRDMKLPVVAYMVAISCMVIAGFGAWGVGHSALIPLGAVGFALSDIAVARNRFVAPGFINRAWGTPLYFVAQLVMAATLLSA
jgi:uncharacterized membrane protein YhhN